ncbi:MAG: hypothetical protein GEU91_03835 [Rhizobiales bacterium]|nr:hypothetical protein [Hyphomicrobiales bacterium]
MLASFGMALRYSFNMIKEADLLDQAIAAALAKGLRTVDIKSEGTTVGGPAQMGDAIREAGGGVTLSQRVRDDR